MTNFSVQKRRRKPKGRRSLMFVCKKALLVNPFDYKYLPVSKSINFLIFKTSRSFQLKNHYRTTAKKPETNRLHVRNNTYLNYRKDHFNQDFYRINIQSLSGACNPAAQKTYLPPRESVLTTRQMD